MNIATINVPKHITIAEIMYRNARKYPNKEAVVFKDRRLNYKEIDDLSNQVANAIIGLGINKGDHVALMMNNSEMFVAVYFGIMKAGGVVIPLNTRFVKREVEFILDNSDAKLIIGGEEFESILWGIKLNVSNLQNVICVGKELPGAYELNELMNNTSQERPQVMVEEDDLCSIIYTSGTTGSPRGAVFDHRRVVYNVSIIGVINHRFTHYTRHLIMMPLFHSAPLHLYMLGTMFVGGTVVIMPAYDPKMFLELVQAEKITHFFGPALVYLTCSKQFDMSKYDLSSVELFLMGGSPASAEDQALIIDQFKLRGRFQQVYGLTEAGPTGTALFPEDIERKPASLGVNGAIGAELVIVDEHLNKIEEPGVVGEIAVLVESAMREYYKDPEKTANTLKNGWILTGDLAKYDEDGYVYFVDRLKDMIISGGQNVYSKEIEDVLMQHPAVSEVAVIGVPHPEWGESVKAVITLLPNRTATADEIIKFCRDKLARFKRPRYVQIVDVLPHNPAGKITKPEVRKLYGQPV
mgnify:CR=1 FL=1